MKKGLLLVFAVILASNIAVYAQSSFDDYRKKMRERFDNYAATEKQRFQEYRAKLNEEYAKYMEEAWDRFEAGIPISIPKTEPEPIPIRVPYEPIRIPDVKIPDVPAVDVPVRDVPLADVPIADIPISDIPDSTPIIPDEVIDLSFDLPAPKPIAPIEKPVDVPVEQGIFLPFYGADVSVAFSGKDLPELKNITEKQISKFWMAMGEQNFDAALYDLQRAREELDLCDWAYFSLCHRLSEELYPDDGNAATLLSAYALCQSGYKIRIGRDSGASKLHILAATDYNMLNRPYWELGGERFFLMDDSGVTSMNIYDRGFEGEQKLRMKISGRNLFPESPTAERVIASSEFPRTRSAVSANANLIEFYKDYPMIMIGSDSRTRWSFYLTELSETAKRNLYPTLRNAIQGKSELEAVEVLLNFIQTGFEYGYDTQIWGDDRAFFPEETLYYPFDDCEDRAVLFARLVKDLLGLKMALIYYPGHLATAVHFNSNVKGDYISIGDEKYTVCDPTYINANVGRTMPNMDNSTAFAILL